MAIKAVIFDMDGVLIDSEPLYRDMVRTFFADVGLMLGVDELNALAGKSNQVFRASVCRWWELAPGVADELRGEDPNELFGAWCDSAYADLTFLELLNPGVPETLEELAGRGVRCALASSSPRHEILQMLDECGLAPYFEVVTSGADLAESKPHPAIYLQSVAKLGLPTDVCIAVEDSDPGIASARAAGLRVAVKRETRLGFAQEGGTWYLDAIPQLLEIVG